jgi:hypothetical protein
LIQWKNCQLQECSLIHTSNSQFFHLKKNFCLPSSTSSSLHYCLFLSGGKGTMKADLSQLAKSLMGQSRTGPALSEESDGFYVMCTGQVESAQVFYVSFFRFYQIIFSLSDFLFTKFQGYDNLYCRYSMSFGPDWRIKQVECRRLQCSG